MAQPANILNQNISIKRLQEMRNFGGEILTHGLKEEILKKFISHDQNLRSAIESAYEHFVVLQKEKPDFLLLSEKEQIKLAQQNIVNFYANENVNPYVAISAMGPWIVTLKGAVIYDCGGYGMLGLGHSPKLALNEIKKPHVMANVMTPSLSQMEFIDILKKEIGHSRTNKSTFTEFCCLNSGSESVSIGARLADVNAKELTAKGAKHFGKSIARLTLSGSFHGRTDRPAQFSDSTRSSYKKTS